MTDKEFVLTTMREYGQDNNVWEPGTVNVKWADLGTIEEVMGA